MAALNKLSYLLMIIISLMPMKPPYCQAFFFNYKTVINGVTLQKVTVYKQHSFNETITHMELDLRNDNFILFSSATKMFTMDLHSKVIFKLTDIHNQNKINLKTLASFSQKNGNQVLLVDIHQHCLYHLDRNTNTTQPFIGKCNEKGYKDGNFGSAQFDYPNMIVRKPDGTSFYLTENYHIRRIDFQDIHSDSVSTELTHTAHAIHGLAIDFTAGIGYYSTEKRIHTFNLANSELSITDLSHSSQKGHTDGSLTIAQFDRPFHLVLLSRETLLALEVPYRELRIVDLKKSFVSSICRPPYSQTPISYGDVNHCFIERPASFLVIPMMSKVLVGDQGRIWQLDYSVTYTEQLYLLYEQYTLKIKNLTVTIWQLFLLVVSLVVGELGLAYLYRRYNRPTVRSVLVETDARPATKSKGTDARPASRSIGTDTSPAASVETTVEPQEESVPETPRQNRQPVVQTPTDLGN